MIGEQTAAVWALVMQVCPGQKYDAYTPQAWHEVIGDLAYDDAVEAVRRAAKTHPFIGTSDICKGVAEIRGERVAAATKGGPVPWPEGVDHDDADAVTRCRQRDMAAIADGRAVVTFTPDGRRTVRYGTRKEIELGAGRD